MKKSAVILMLLIQTFLLFVFQNMYALYKGIEKIDFSKRINQLKVLHNLNKSKDIFLILSILIGIFIIITSIYLIVLFKRAKTDNGIEKIPPLENYLMELKTSELTLKNIVAKQKEDVSEKEELNNCIINNINSAIILLNTSDRIAIFNSIAENIFNQSYANAKNNTLATILKPYPEILTYLSQFPEEKTSSEVRSKDQVFFIDLIPLKNIGKLIMIKDITEDKKKDEINRLNHNFIMLGEMAAYLTHEIRNSLGVIMGYTKTIKAEKEKISKVNSEINFLSTMMDNFLSFSKPVQVKENIKFDLCSLIRKIADENKIQVQLTRKSFALVNNETLMASIFSNLILNSKEAQATKIVISIKNQKHPIILFKDNGRGFNEKDRDKVWFPFFTTKSKGTGMGLAIVKKITHSLNGEISLVESSKEGTIFQIILYT